MQTSELAAQYFPLVKKVARRIGRRCPPHVDVKDLEQAGAVGLLTGLRRWDDASAEGLDAYVAVTIRGAILDELRRDDVLSRGDRRAARALASAARSAPYPASTQELAERSGLTLEHITRLQSMQSRPSLLDEELVADAGPNPLECAVERETKACLTNALQRLSVRETEILHLSADGVSLRDIGRRLGVSESRVCQLRTQAILRLRQAMTHDENAR